MKRFYQKQGGKTIMVDQGEFAGLLLGKKIYSW
jgi:hypothetical protein